MFRYRDPYYMSYASGYDPYYSAIHAYSQEVARSARDEIEKQAEDLRNFRKAMLGMDGNCSLAQNSCLLRNFE